MSPRKEGELIYQNGMKYGGCGKYNLVLMHLLTQWQKETGNNIFICLAHAYDDSDKENKLPEHEVVIIGPKDTNSDDLNWKSFADMSENGHSDLTVACPWSDNMSNISNYKGDFEMACETWLDKGKMISVAEKNHYPDGDYQNMILGHPLHYFEADEAS